MHLSPRRLVGADGVLRHRTQHGYVVDEIGSWIVDGRVAPGQTLPPEPELCVSLGVSRGALREAMKALAAKGMVEMRPRTGTAVREQRHWNFLDGAVLRWSAVSDRDALLQNLWELRLAVEPAAARLAARRATAEDRAVIAGACEGMHAANIAGEHVAFNDADVEFHTALLHASHNELYGSLNNALSLALRVSFDITSRVPGGPHATLPRHQAIADAVAHGDEEAASRAAEQLMQSVPTDFKAVGRGEPGTSSRRDTPHSPEGRAGTPGATDQPG
jgi:DNA-binding FadR family transcriptional regulator